MTIDEVANKTIKKMFENYILFLHSNMEGKYEIGTLLDLTMQVFISSMFVSMKFFAKDDSTITEQIEKFENQLSEAVLNLDMTSILTIFAADNNILFKKEKTIQ